MHQMCAICLVRVLLPATFEDCMNVRLKQLLRPWYMPSSPASPTTATASCMVSEQFTSVRRTMYSIQLHVSLCKTKLDHITVDIHKFWHWLPVQQRIECRVEYVCAHIPVSTSDSTHLPLRVMHPVAATASMSQLHSAVQGNLISYCRTKRSRHRSFTYSGLALWNGTHFH